MQGCISYVIDPSVRRCQRHLAWVSQWRRAHYWEIEGVIDSPCVIQSTVLMSTEEYLDLVVVVVVVGLRPIFSESLVPRL